MICTSHASNVCPSGSGSGSASSGSGCAAAAAAAAAAQPEPEPEGQTLDAWLVQIKLQRYSAAIKEAGYDELEFLLDAEEGDLDEMIAEIDMKKAHARTFKRAWKELLGGGGASPGTGALQSPPAAGLQSPPAGGSPMAAAAGAGTDW